MNRSIKFLFLFLLIGCSKKSMILEDINPVPIDAIITFNKHIKPLFSSKCSPCHTAGGDRNNKYDEYNTSKTLITGIIGRIKKEANETLFMPKNGTKLTKEQMDLVNRWINDGFLEK
jgi:uncharacterized membrane protein